MLYPTIDHVRNETGEDMIINAGTELKANAEIKQYAEFLLRELKKQNTHKNYKNITTLITTNANWHGAWMKAVCSFIYEDYNTTREKSEIAQEIISTTELISRKRVILW